MVVSIINKFGHLLLLESLVQVDTVIFEVLRFYIIPEFVVEFPVEGQRLRGANQVEDLGLRLCLEYSS